MILTSVAILAQDFQEFKAGVMSATAACDAVRKIALRLSRASSVWSLEDEEEGVALAVMLVDTLNRKAQCIIAAKTDLPLAYSYQSDATSFLTRVVETTVCNGELVRREGRELTELLIERAHIQMLLPSGVLQSAIIVRPPRLLKFGKGIDACITAYQEFWPSMRLHRTGIIINHKCFDRAIYDGLEKDLIGVSDARILNDEMRFVQSTSGKHRLYSI